LRRLSRVQHLRLVELVLVHLAHVRLVHVVTHRSHYLIQAAHYGGVGDAKLGFNVLDLALALQKGLNELHLLRRKRLQPAQPEDAVYARPALLTLQTSNVQGVAANGAFPGHLVHFLSPPD
jgi:hypothetical protein